MVGISGYVRSAATIALALGVVSCGSEEAVEPVLPEVEAAAAVAADGDAALQSESANTGEALAARVAADAVLLMDRDGFSNTYDKLGANQFQNANDLTHWAAIAAVAQGSACDRVAMVNVSDRATRDNIVWFVDCQNSIRIMIEQAEAEDARRRFGNSQ